MVPQLQEREAVDCNFGISWIQKLARMLVVLSSRMTSLLFLLKNSEDRRGRGLKSLRHRGPLHGAF